MNVLAKILAISAADTILGEFFKTADNIQDIADAMGTAEFRAACEQENIEYQQLVEELERRPDLVDVNYFHYNEDAFRAFKNQLVDRNYVNLHNYLKEYETLRQEAATVGLNAAAFMPRAVNGDLMGTPKMFMVSFLKLRIEIQRRRSHADSGQELLWALKNIIAHNEGDVRDRKIRKIIKPKPKKNMLESNEEYKYAVSGLEKIGYKHGEAAQMVLQVVEDYPDMQTESIITYVLKHRRQ